MSEVSSVGTTDFEAEVVHHQGPVVVDFSAEWCPPCRMLAPLLDKLAQQYAGQLKVVKCDVDSNEDLAQQYGVGKIPNLMFFKDGQVVTQAVGYISEAELGAKVNEVLNS